MTSRPTVVVAIHDGFYGAGTGAGYANRAFLESLFRHLDPRVHVVVLPVWVPPSSGEYTAPWHRQTAALCDRARVTVIPVDNGTGGRTRFGGLPAFRRLAVDTALTLQTHVIPTASPLLVIAFDVPFLGLPPLLPPHVLPSVVLVPRSTALLHDRDDHDRVSWEHHGLLTTTRGGGRIAAISAHMRTHLRTDYQVPEAHLVNLPDGLTGADRRFGAPDGTLLPPAGHGGFLLSMGRAQPYKGFDDLLDALILLRDQRHAVAPLLLAAVTEDPEPSTFQRHLAVRITRHRLDVTLLTRFAHTVRDLLTHPALRGVIVPSRDEPFGRIPLEAYAAGAPVVATTAGGLAEQVIDGATGFTCPPNHPAGLAGAIRRLMSTDTADRQRMTAAGRTLLDQRFNHDHATGTFLRTVAGWASTCSASH